MHFLKQRHQDTPSLFVSITEALATELEPFLQHVIPPLEHARNLSNASAAKRKKREELTVLSDHFKRKWRANSESWRKSTRRSCARSATCWQVL